MTCWFIEAQVKFCMTKVKGDFDGYTFNVALHVDAYELNFFKLGVVIDTTKLQFDTILNSRYLHSMSQEN